MNKKMAEGIVDAIIRDLSDRKGLGNEWEEIDDDIQKQIREEWITLVVEHSGPPRVKSKEK
jgi:hypothetical protein